MFPEILQLVLLWLLLKRIWLNKKVHCRLCVSIGYSEFFFGVDGNMRQSYPSTAQYKEALKLINDSVGGEQADAMFYEWLISNIPDELDEVEKLEIAQVIQGIASDERLHNEILKSMYRQLTGKETMSKEEEFIPPENFQQGIVRALKGEMEAVRRYRKIRAGIPDESYRDQVFSILTDELRHGILYNYIFTIIRSS